MPYTGKEIKDWAGVTKKLIEQHPLKTKEIVEVSLKCWDDIFKSTFGKFKIGKEICPKPQMMGFLLHELIPLEFSSRYPKAWRPEKSAADKDLVYITDNKFSIEIKTSSSKGKIYGNRSYSQESGSGKKSKSGYYLAINFTKFSGATLPVINLIRFGWLDHGDWKGQEAASGQQSRLPLDVENSKLLKIYELK